MICLACSPFAVLSVAADEVPANASGGFGTAALELRRLPSTTVAGDRRAAESANDATALAADVVSFSEFDVAADSNLWDAGETRLYVGYDRGFLIAADQGMDAGASSSNFLMRVNSWMHFRHTLFESDGPNADQNTFSFERLRLSFGGHVLSPDVKYFFQLDGNSDRASQTIFLDYFVNYDVGHDRFGLDKNRLGFKLGKWKVPFSRSRRESGKSLQFADRATANVFFDLNRSFGVGLTSEIPSAGWLGRSDAPVELETAIFNGYGTGSVDTDRGGGLDRNFGWSLRAQRDLHGNFGNDGEPDLAWHESPAVRLGGGLAYTRVDVEGGSEFRRERAVDSGAALSTILPATVTAYDVCLYTVDAHLKYHGFSLIADYYWRYVSQFSGAAVPGLFDDGFVLQTGYFVIAHKLEFIARWSRIRGDSGTLGLSDSSSDEVAGGLVWYLKGQNAKLTFDATHINGVPVSSSRLDILPGDAGWLFRTQMQLSF